MVHDLERTYGGARCQRAEDRMMADADSLTRGGQGRDDDEPARDASAFVVLLGVVALALLVLGLLAGCGTVEGLGDDLSALSRGVRAEMAKD